MLIKVEVFNNYKNLLKSADLKKNNNEMKNENKNENSSINLKNFHDKFIAIEEL